MGKIEQKYGSLKIIWHPDKLKSLLEKKITAPLYVRIKPTNKCNHNCFYCAYKNLKCDHSQRFNRSDEIPKNKMMEILKDFKEIGVRAVTYSGGGEPLIYPSIVDVIQKTAKYGIDLSMITNGQKLAGEKAELLTQAKWVRVSLDVNDAETFSQVRGIRKEYFYELIGNIENFAKKKNPDCELGINCVVHKENANQIYTIVKFFKELGVNHIKLTPVWLGENSFEYHAPIKDKAIEEISKAREDLQTENFAVYDTFEDDFNFASVGKRGYTRCPIMQIVSNIGADSTVYFCLDKSYSNSGVLGSIKERSFRDLWFSKEAKKIFETFNPQQSCMHHCTADLKNMFILSALGCYGEHLNFI